MQQFELPLDGNETPNSREESLTKETLLAMTEEERALLYKKHIGQSPRLSMEIEKVIYGIINPEEEKIRIFSENREEDQDDARSHYPGGNKSA